MKKTAVFLTFIMIFPFVYSYAQDTRTEYVIQKGDTLWDISDFELTDTFLWPKLWNVNPHIDNPDLIYPGQTIIIPSREELMRMPPVQKKPLVLKKRRKPVVKPAFIKPEKTVQKYIIDRDLYLSSGWISATYPSIGEIVYAPMDRQLTGRSDTVYLKFFDIKEPKGKFFVIRDIKMVKHPVTNKKLGRHIRITGIVEIIGEDSDMPKATVLKSYQELQNGDGLIPYQEIEPPLIPVVARTPDINGYIVESHMNTRLVGEGDVIFLDRGGKDGIEVGDIFSVLSDFPTERTIAMIQVIALKQSTSAALVVDGTQELFVGGKWGKK